MKKMSKNPFIAPVKLDENNIDQTPCEFIDLSYEDCPAELIAGQPRVKRRESLHQKEKSMQIYETLKADHDAVKQLLNELVKLQENEFDMARDLIDQIRDELIPHSRAEESVFYNTLRSLSAANDVIMHGYQEHVEAEMHLRMLQVRERIDAEWMESAQKLKKALEHHISEEEGKVFSVAKQLLSEDEAEMIGEAFERLKPEVKTEGFMKTTMDLIANLMPPRLADAFKTSGSTSKHVHQTVR